MKPVIYIMAAILATIAGFAAVEIARMENKSPIVQTKPQQSTASVQKKEQVKKSTYSQTPVTGLKGLNKGHMTTFVVRPQPQDIPEFEFVIEDGTKKTLKDWSGKVVLLNLWATWCAPCRKEMPWFDDLKAKLGGDKFDVVTISIDRGNIEKPKNFFKRINIKNLVLYHDPTARLGSKLNAFGMPTTLLINSQGKEIGRLVGPAEWHSDDAVKLLEAAIKLDG